MTQKVAIVGGGMVGATVAYYLSKLPGNTQQEVTLYDDGTGQATKAAAGIISPWLSKRRNKRWYELAKAGADLLPQLAREANLSNAVYQQTGTIITRSNDADLESLYQLAQNRRKDAPQMGTVSQLTSEEVSQMIPLLHQPHPGILVSGGARIDGAQYTESLLKIAQTKNLKVKNEKVSLNSDGNIVTARGIVKFDRVIVATGGWLKQTLEPLGIEADIRPQKGQLIELSVKNYEDHQVMPVLMPEGERDFIPFGNGSLIVGATHEDENGFNLEQTSEAKKDLFASAKAMVPELTIDKITGMRVGTRGYSSDFAPFFGPVPFFRKVLVAGGLGSSGLTTGPIIGKLLAGSIIFGGEPDWSNYEKALDIYLKRL